MSSRTRSSARCQASALSIRTVPRSVPSRGMALAVAPAPTAPHTRDMACRGSARRDSRPGTSVITRPRASTTSTVTCGRAVALRPGHAHLHPVAGRRDGAGANPTSPVSSCGSQCRAKICCTSFRTPPSMAASAPPGSDSSAGWKTTRTAPGQIARLGQCPGRADEDGGVRVMAARMADARHRRPVRDVLGVVHGKGVDVGPEGDGARSRTDVADQARAARQDGRCQPGCHQLGAHGRRGLELAEAELGLAVDATAQADDLGRVRRHPGIGPDGVGPGGAGGHDRPTRISASRASTTARRSPPFSVATRRWRS